MSTLLRDAIVPPRPVHKTDLVIVWQDEMLVRRGKNELGGFGF